MALCSYTLPFYRHIAITVIILWHLQQVNSAYEEDEDRHEGYIPMLHEEIQKMCDEPPGPLNGELSCGLNKKRKNKYVCRAECEPGFEFPNGKSKKKHTCDMETGKWSPKFIFPDCRPICNPPCENGGECSDANHCICTAQYRGDRCQYAISLCQPNEGLHASADWSCNHTMSETLCVFNCPQNTRYESQPADVYHCSLDGTWMPSFAPKCIPINVIEPPASPAAYASPTGQIINSKLPKSAVCATWSASHYRTFDGGIYSFQGRCSYLFAKDCEQNTFAIHIQNGEVCDSVSSCPTTVAIYIGTEQYLLYNGDDGPAVLSAGQTHLVPTAVNGLLFEMISDYVTLISPLGFNLKWNRKNTILLKVNSQLRNRTCGLCGKFDGSTMNDFETSDGSNTDSVEGFANSWIMDELLEEKCEHKGVVKDPCSDNKDKVSEAEKLCQAIFDKKFEVCHQLVDPKIYYEACKMDHCGCQSPGMSCYCGSLAEYFRECIRIGGKIDGGWRSEDLCPLACPDGMIYQDCGTSCPKTCKGTVYDCEDNHCVDGCHCPDGTYLYNGRCLERQNCPCLHGGKEYQPGERMLQDCNACECNAGDWECTDEKCEARCSSTGDPHYTTFDGLSYEFLGSCPYYLVYHADFTIVQESGPCPASSSSEPATESMFCTLAIRITYLGDSLTLQPGIKMSFNEKEVSLPFSAIGFNAAMVTDIFLKVNLQNGVSLLWDGQNRIYIDAPPTLFGQTMGLCGTFNRNQNDDFQTPEKDVEADVATFASRWQASDTCHKRSRRSMRSPCETQPQKLSDAKMLCSAIIGKVFQACHGELDPDVYYKSCISDLCLCGENLEDCVCPILADYSLSCAKRGIILNWMDDIPPCKPDCTGGQVYKECGNPCTSTCMAIASSEDCKSQCVQGCICPDGMTMNSEGFCIAIDQCPCVFDDKEYSPESVTVQGSKICTCQSGKWECRPGTLEELVYMNPDLMVQDQPTGAKACLAENNEEFTQCVETCPKTCQNAHLPPRCKTEECKSGCRCKEGFILDADLNTCVKETQCGCLHSGRRYKEGETIKQHCNLCFCSEGSWQCTEKVCPGVCSSWGESHFKTYDGKIFDFQGECEYILSKGKMKGASFTLSVQNVPCGTNGITCSKSFTLDLGPATSEHGTGEHEKLTLSRDDPLPKVTYNSRFVVMDSGLFVLVFSDIGISLQWDRGTRLYINADPKWRNRVKGLCGNFNDDQTDDFLTPSGGIPEARASIFADSWKIHEFCPLPQTVEDMCSVHPQRQGWAQQKCGILKSDVFAPCHSAVKLDPYYERCVFDSCACDMGGDCDCLCTAIAAYAHECSAEGVPIKWRSQELCPIQCEECATYESCIPSCPKMTCENELIYGKIKEACTFDFCVEGCNPKPCPEGQIYNNGREYKCVPQTDCVVPCMEVNGVLYNEGDRITDPQVVDSCQSCHCRRGSIDCVGKPCIKEQPQACLRGGWTPWMNTPSFIGGDREDLKHPLLRATYDKFCGVANMTNIECRVAETKTSYKETGQKVDCSLPSGLTCRDDEQYNEICKDYEIRVFCDCGAELLIVTLPPTTPHPPLPPICEETGWTAWMNAHLPGEEGESETLESLRINHQFCADEEIENIECRTTLGWREAPAGDNAICNKKLGLVCSGSDCNDYEVRVFCNCGKEIPTAPSCVSGWTEYFNTDNPDVSDIGDDESIERIRERHTFCIGGTLEDIECKTKINGETVDYSTLDTFGLKCSKKEGFICNRYVRTDKCPDFFVRFYCACEPVVPTTAVPATLPPTTPTPVPVTPVPVECGWTPWLNLDTPESSENDDGDIEDLSQIQMLYKTCGGKDLVDIECRMSRTHHSYLESQQKNLVCDLHKGFRCFNIDQIGKCYDYEIRLLCMYDWCYPPTTTPVQTTPLPITTQNPCADGQVFDECAYRCDRLCSSFSYELAGQCAEGECIASCRPVEGCEPPNMWRDYYSCVPKDECPCVLIEGENVTSVAPNDVLIKDCEKCQCIYNDLTCFDIPGCGTTEGTPYPVKYIPENITREDCWTEWINIDTPKTGGGDLETLSKIREKFIFCLDPVQIECRTVESKQKPFDVGQVVTCDLNTGLICWNTDNKPEECYDYEIRFFCPCATTQPPTTTTTTPLPTFEPGPCVYGWTDWYNSHTPDDRGDYESVQSARVSSAQFCANNMISAIECRPVNPVNVGKDVANSYLLQHGVHCDLQTGLICSQESLGESEACWDYEVRFFCDCPTMAPLTETITSLPVTTKLPFVTSCDYWSDWINEHHPSSAKSGGVKGGGVKGGGGNRGDSEKAMLLRLQREYKFCVEGFLSDIECREADTDLHYSETGDKKLMCSLHGGFRCRARDQPNRLCKDYKIRYYCSCKVATTTTTPIITTTPTIPPITVEPCTVYYDIVDGPLPLPDSSLKASSSRSEDSGPHNARLSSVVTSNSAGAWIAGEINEFQFIEVDLGRIQPVYGVITKGRSGYPEWVKSYKVLYSRDGMGYAYVSDTNGDEKIFSGNYDNESPVKHVFERPFEARYIRIQPLTYHKELALRLGILGCAEGMTTLPSTTPYVPPCVEEMGMHNGMISDYQIKTSSNRRPNSDGRFVRLNTPQTEDHSGGWVSEFLDKDQYVQIAFFDERTLTGVKIQGRDEVPQWVTAFTVSYSKDGATWSYIMDAKGNKVIFPGNYDSNSVGIVYFPQPIKARFIRINPVAWENWISMRLEILGCFPEEEVKANITEPTEPPILEGCTDPMGFENGELPDTLITVSSTNGPGTGVSRIRLNTHADGELTGGWVPALYDYKPVVLIDFYGERNLTGITTQGREDASMWVISYTVQYSLDNYTWIDIYEMDNKDKVFSGNFDRNTPVTKWFRYMIQARFLKITILDYHNKPALRMEVFGCFIPYEFETELPEILHTTTEICVQYGPWLSLSDPASSYFGDEEPIDQIIAASGLCRNPYEIQCRNMMTHKDYSSTGQIVRCDLEHGLLCKNEDQTSHQCYNYEVRLKCWTCGMETTTELIPLVLCPEVPEYLKENCPVSCPYTYACDGSTCVPRIDCPCFKDGKRFEPSNIAVTKNCERCECIIEGHSICKRIECPDCLPGQISQMDEHCNCECVGCAEGTVLCPTNGYCIREEQWCDGIADCPDDEINCPTTMPPTTTTTIITTTEVPTCTTDSSSDTDTCEMIANMFETFDGTTYEYEICDHVLMKDISSNSYSVTVHKACLSEKANSCVRYLIIEVDGLNFKIGPSIEDITIQDTVVPTSNLWLVSQRFKDHFELKKKGTALIFRSKKYHFDVIWDNLHDAAIQVSKCLIGQTAGLCGLYNKEQFDDKTTPDGRLEKDTEKFGNSWSVGSLERCMLPTCPFDVKKKATEVCEELRKEPFSTYCSEYVKLESRIHSCISFMCECLQQTIDARMRPSKDKDVFYEFEFTTSCKCLAYDSFVEACERAIHQPVSEWRIQYDCTPDCPPGMEWQDCGPGCELTCDNYHERDSICSNDCIPGCYCPSGTIRHHNRCVKPKMCQDCVCRGHGDPNYITFDGRYYAFQGVCTYVLAQHQTSEDPRKNFQILGINIECPEEPHTSCTEGLRIYWNGHTIEKFKNKPVYVDDMSLGEEDSIFEHDGISITFVPGKSTIIHIKEINLAVRYFDQIYGFNIELPAFFYFNKTEGLCGVCNFIQSDDLYHRNGYVTEDIEDFGYSWLQEKTKDSCKLERIIVPEPPPGICNFTSSSCEILLDPTLYSASCQNDVTYSQKPEASMCRSKFQYAEQCCEKGISLVEWLELSGCENSCPEGMHFECTSACPKTCDNYKNYDADDCDLMPLYTCTCPEGQVIKQGKCIDSILCETCDALGHIVGDVWNVGPCEQCECLEDLSTRCTVTECPEPPICNENEKLEKLIKAVNTCCDAYQCIEEVIECPEPILQECAKGEANVKFTKEDGCPAYKCECAPDLCPPLVEPPLYDGEVNTLETVGCCPEYKTICYPEKCELPPLCGPGFKIATFEGRCCTKYNCVPKKNVCVYQHQFDVLNGIQVDLLPENYYEVEYSSGDTWWDGLCRNCSCTETEGQYISSCRIQMCADISSSQVAEKYVHEKIPVPGACCPKYRRISCLVGGIAYEIGQEWPSPEGDKCKNYRCITDKDGEAIVLEITTKCNRTCSINAKYEEPLPESEECCGSCKLFACEENGVIYENGATWDSTTDPCYTANCSVNENGTLIRYSKESCPVMPDNCPTENVVTDPKGCCTYCKMTKETCSAVQVPLYETRGFFEYIDKERGLCTNGESLPDLTKCSGTCTAESRYSKLIGDFQSICNCCLPQKTKDRTIVLTCEDGSQVQKTYQQPITCQCSTCSGNDLDLEALNSIEPY